MPHATRRFAPVSRESARDHSTHTAYFYSSDAALATEIGQELAEVLASGGAAGAIVTPAHRIALEKRLAACGIDLVRAAAESRWRAMDASVTISGMMIEGWPDARRFHAAMGELAQELAAATETRHPRVALFGEMVSLLWESGKWDAALRIEELWNDLARTHTFQLFCGWPLRFFSRDLEGAALDEICRRHNRILPAQGYEAMSEGTRRRNSVLWQLKAQALEEKVCQSKRLQEKMETRERDLRDLLEDAAIGMQWLAPDGAITWANRSQLAHLGYTGGEYIGRNISDFLTDPAAASEFLKRVSSGENICGCQLQIRRREGTLRWIRVDANPRFEDGRLVEMRCFVTDITEQRVAFEAQMKLAAIVESSDDAIASKDLTGIITSWNAAAERILGYKAEEIIGRSVLTIIPPELHSDEPEILRKIRSGERIEHFETVRLTKAGERIDVSLTVSPVRDQHGTIVGAAKILRDITAQKKLETTLRTTERLASVGRLAATVAHEINNPLEAITNLIYIARREPNLPPNARTCLIAADEELQRVSHIARQTLGFYRDTSAPVWISVADSIDEVLTVYERRFRYKGISVLRDLPADLRICVLQGEFKQIVSNLISNAIDASPQGRPVHIRAWHSHNARTHAEGIRLTVADYGTGISPENRRKIFTPFFTTKKDVGTGLGLWIVRDLLEKKGGFIACRSRLEDPASAKSSGTVMTIFVPTESCPREQRAG